MTTGESEGEQRDGAWKRPDSSSGRFGKGVVAVARHHKRTKKPRWRSLKPAEFAAILVAFGTALSGLAALTQALR